MELETMNPNNQKLREIKQLKHHFLHKMNKTTDQQELYKLSKIIEQLDVKENQILKEEL